jgi:acetyl-CoA carboxylase carboxyltransferase component
MVQQPAAGVLEIRDAGGGGARMSWEEEIDELRRRETLAKQMGGPDKVKRQRDGGKFTVRERVDRLLDKDSFHEIGALAGWAKYAEDGELSDFTPANLIFGRGRIAGRAVAITGDDFTVRGGANDGGIKQKLLAVQRMACDLRLPLVRLVDGTGGGGSVKNLELQGHSPMPKAFLWDWWTDNLAEVPVVSLALGSVAGLGAARVAASHYSVMVKDTSQMFVAGPPVVEWTHGKFEKNELGGSHIHTRNGAVDDEAASEDEAFERTRKFLSYLPLLYPCTSWPRGSRAAMTRKEASRGCWRRCRTIRASRMPCEKSSARWSTGIHSSRSASSGAARSSPGSRASTAGRSR